MNSLNLQKSSGIDLREDISSKELGFKEGIRLIAHKGIRTQLA
tara:strand:+ start:214 stop:342 length:129 start_codon:yes stop_codon:yes gene_type:complete